MTRTEVMSASSCVNTAFICTKLLSYHAILFMLRERECHRCAVDGTSTHPVAQKQLPEHSSLLQYVENGPL